MLRLLGFPLLDFVKYIVGLLLIVYVPGRAILWAARLEAGRLANTTLSLVLGLTSTAVIYKLAGFLKAEAVFFFWILAGAVFLSSRASSGRRGGRLGPFGSGLKASGWPASVWPLC
jgi:hypothetical protein